AIDAWSSAAARRPEEPKYKARIGYWQSQAGQLEPAQATLNEVLKKQWDSVSAAELGFVKFRKGDPKGAAALLKDVIKKDPSSMAAHYYLGAVLYQQRDPKGATAEYLEADKLAPQDARPLTALCEMQAQTGAPEIAETRKTIESRFEDGKKISASCSI